MRGNGLLRSHPGLRRILCVSLVMGLVISSFTGFVYADQIDDEEPVVVADQIDDQDDQDVVVNDDIDNDDQNDDIVDDQDVDDQDDQDIASDDEITDEDVTDDDQDVSDDENVDEDVVEEADEEPVFFVDDTSKKILIWNVESAYAKYIPMIRDRYLTIDGVSVDIKTSGEMTAAELQGVDLVYLICWHLESDSTQGQNIINSAAVLKSYVEQGGRVVLNGEWRTFADAGDDTLEMLGAGMGYNFKFVGVSDNHDSVLNTEGRPELTKNIEKDFKSSAFAKIQTSDPDTEWVAKDTDGNVFITVRPTGQGIIFLISDVNYLNTGDYAEEVSTALLANMAGYKYVHKHKIAYSADGAELTVACKAGACTLEERSATLTIKAPEKTHVEDGKSVKATLEGVDKFNAIASITGDSVAEADILYTGTGSTNYAASSTAPTAAGTYKASVTVGGVTASVEYEIEPIKYSFDDTEKSWTKESSDTLSFRATRNYNDDTTIDHFAGAKVDDKAVDAANMNVTKGSVIVELKTVFLNTLDVGTHTITFSFDDAEDISMTFIVKAAPKTSPQTGEHAGPAVLAAAMLLLAASSYAGVKVFKKKEI